MNNLFFIDIHTHGSYGIDFNLANYDEIKFLLKELYKRNIKGICPTLIGDNKENIQKQLSIFNKIKEEQNNKIENETYVIGVHLEGTFLSPNKAGIQSKEVFLKPTIANFKDLVGDYEKIIKVVTIAPEEDVDLIEYLNKQNIITQAGHSISTTVSKCAGVTHIFNAMNPMHHRDNSIVLEALVNDDIYTEVIADLIHLNKNIINLIFKTKPVNKILLISDSLPSSHSDKEIIFCNKKINIAGKDENGTLAGSNKTLDEICINLIEKNILTKEDIIQVAFKNQIKYLKLNNKEIDILNR